MATVAIHQGILNLPGATLASKKEAQNLLAKDHDKHHCYFRSIGFHNHLSHHILAAYDLGASTELLRAIYEEEAKIQRPIMLEGEETGVTKPGEINEKNWKEYLGEQKAYAAYAHFFGEQVKSLGAVEAVEKFIFSPEANENGTEMLIRLVSGALHPFIQLGFAAEFGSDPNLVSAALAQASIHKYRDTGIEAFKYVPSEKKLPLLQVVGEIARSEILKPVMPYKPDATFNDRIRDAFGGPSGRGDELARLCSMWDIPSPLTQAGLDKIVEEAIWMATLGFAGSSKPNRKPRLDFFIMHGLTSSLFIPSLCKNLVKNPESQARLIRHWHAIVQIVSITRGRPQVHADVLMGYTDKPLPPNYNNVFPTPDKSAITPPSAPQDGVNPWTLLVQSALRAPDSHTLKSLRTLLYGATHYGTTEAGKAPGALDKEGKEAIPGFAKLDGTIFVRAAGVLMNTIGWVDWGQPEGDWDRSALGWDDAWNDEQEAKM